MTERARQGALRPNAFFERPTLVSMWNFNATEKFGMIFNQFVILDTRVVHRRPYIVLGGRHVCSDTKVRLEL